MAAKAYGRIVFWEGASLWVLRAARGERYPRTDVHSHHVIQLTLALTGCVELDGEAGRLTGTSIAVAPDAPHAFAGTETVAHLFIASDGQVGREIARALFAEGTIVHVPAELLGDVPSRVLARFEDPKHTADDFRALGRELLARLAGRAARAPRTDPRISRVITWLSGHLDKSVSLGDVAAVAGLSKGRTRHLFVEQTGLSFRTYLLWLRLVRAVETYAGGASLTDAAHGAGFADSAHLSRTFRRMFGVTAVSLRLA